jgi:hypothetical protein
MAALNCMEIGARGGIRDAAAARELIAAGQRRSKRDFVQRASS